MALSFLAGKIRTVKGKTKRKRKAKEFACGAVGI